MRGFEYGEGTSRLPENDDDRLLFYAELIVANMALLTTDLSSAKYTLLSFSEKSRNEVRLKLALLQSIDRTLRDVIQIHKTVQDKEKELQDSEVRLVTATPPRFVANVEAETEHKTTSGIVVKKSEPTEDKSQIPPSSQQSTIVTAVVAEGEGQVMEERQIVEDVTPIIEDAKPKTIQVQPVPITLTEEDLQPVRAAEAALESETEGLAELHKDINSLEDALDTKHTAAEAATRRVQGAKQRCEELEQCSTYAKQEITVLILLLEEVKQRGMVLQNARRALVATQRECWSEELDLIVATIKNAEEKVKSIQSELEERRKRHEVELAAYQIAYKEEQAAADTLKTHIMNVRQRQHHVERLAKEQQIIESEYNSITHMLSKAWRSSIDRTTQIPLTHELEKQLINDHALVTELAARISIMDEQRRNIAAILVQAGDTEDDAVVKSAIERIQTILQPPLKLDENAFSSDEIDDLRVDQ